jgi:hypothetical protein
VNITSMGLLTFRPNYIPGIRLWLDASNVSNGSNPTNGSAVSSWVDLSGVSGNATQATSGQRPTFHVNIQNSLPGVQFTSASSQCMQVASISLGSQITVFAALRCNTVNTWFMEQSPDINSNDGFYMYNGGFATQIKNSGVNVMTANIAGWLGTSPALGMIRYDGANAVAWLNGALYPGSTGTGSITNNNVTNVLNIGSRNQAALFFNGYLHELIIYNGALTDARVGLVNEYLRRKWALY